MASDELSPRGSHSLQPLITVRDIVLPHELDEDIDPPKPPLGTRLRKYSPLRILLGLSLLGGAGALAAWRIQQRIIDSAPVRATFFAPYVDETLPPAYAFQDPTQNDAKQTVLGFIVASGSNGCSPTWGDAYSLAAANQQLALSSRLVEYQSIGGTAIVSFGGQAHTHLSMACRTPTALASAYQQVIQAYGQRIVDFDIEGPALASPAATLRRAEALSIVARADRGLAIWVTLPATPTGLSDPGIAVVRQLLLHHVPIAGVNVMTMDFTSTPGGMVGTIERSLTDAHAQLTTLFGQYRIRLNAHQIWNHMGMTFQIGQNNMLGERVSTQQAAQLVAWARSQAIGRVSFWSLNRDAPCAASLANEPIYSNTCSDAQSAPLAFSSEIEHLVPASVQRTHGLIELNTTVSTNPANAPFPIWNASFPYPAGYKVVWNGYIYEAKWYNQGQQPTQQFEYAYETPWELLGPVLATDHAPKLPTLPPGADPTWQPTVTYQPGQVVEFEGLPYQAKWANQAQSPASAMVDPSISPWQPLWTYPGEPPLSAGS
jgi:chitinase